MSRLTRALKALATPDEKMATVATSPRDRAGVGPYQNPNVDQPISATRAPPGARQQWQLYKVREACRDLELRSPMIGGYSRYIRIQAVGSEPARLDFDRLTREQIVRLKEPLTYLRNEWRRFQTMRNVGGTGRSIHQMAGSVLHHVVIDGDCFLTQRGPPGKRIWDLHPGDALNEAQFRTGIGGQRGNRQLGIEHDGYGRPVRYAFRNGGLLTPLNVEYSSFGGGGSELLVQANRVQHIRNLSGEITAPRGWPWPVQSIDDIARVNEWYEAGARSATTRASIGIALKRTDGMGPPPPVDDMDGMGAALAQEFVNERIPRYQEFQRNAGSVMELAPGWDVETIPAPSPSAQEALMIAMLERRVCANLRVSPATLLGDYKAVSYSGGLLAVLQEQEMIKEAQQMLGQQYYAPVYKDWFAAPVRLMDFVSMFPEVDLAKDMDALLYPQFRLKQYQTLDLSKMVKPVLEAWGAGVLTYSEARQQLGFVGVDVDATIAEWKEDRKKLGLPETPSAGGGMSEPPGADKDEDEDENEDGEEEDEDEDGDA